MQQLQDIMEYKMSDLNEMYEHIMQFYLDQDDNNRHKKCPHVVILTKRVGTRNRIEWFYENVDCWWFENEYTDGCYAFADPTIAMAFKLRWL